MKDKIRESNFELLRIIAMFFIVLFHFIVPTGGNLINSTSGYTQIFFQLIAILMIVHVNSFLLLTGYFQHDKKFKLKKVFDLVLMAWMYKVVIGLAFYFFSSNTYETMELVTIPTKALKATRIRLTTIPTILVFTIFSCLDMLLTLTFY